MIERGTLDQKQSDQSSVGISMQVVAPTQIPDAFSLLASDLHKYIYECPPRGTIGHPGGQQKKFLPFSNGRDLVAFNGTGL